MHIEILLAIFIISYLRKFMRENALHTEWDKAVSTILIVSIALFIAQTTIPSTRITLMWVCYIAMGWLTYIILTRQEFAPTRPVLFIVLPYMAIEVIAEVINLISHKWYNSWSGLIGTGKVFAVVWLIAMWIINNKQKKALDKQKKKTEEVEKEIKITESIKAELEIQVAERTAALTRQKEELEHALADLKNTQKQLIQAEKMASLGELTAGIAHEIQNPLNFVTNFAEVNKELLVEMREEMDKGNADAVKEIANDIVENEEKIHHHARRADAIVKGMLQHSRTSKGIKEPADINALADEYLRLSYHGLRAKDKSFNAAMHASFDESIGKINIIPQDIGRVLLNLFNNAFYAVTEKKKGAGTEGVSSNLPGLKDYQPEVNLTTKRTATAVVITIADNGNGIPQKIIDKIFQPFFTTKPTGQGTGLGLSLSYDIIKAHNGDIKVETKEGEGTTFIIQLPVA